MNSNDQIGHQTGQLLQGYSVLAGAAKITMLAAALVACLLCSSNVYGDQPFLVQDINPGGNDSHSSPGQWIQVGDTLFFSSIDDIHGRELWKITNPAAGAQLVKDINPDNSSSPSSFVEFNGMLFFIASGSNDGMTELWKSDGSEEGTMKITSLGEDAFYLTEAGGMLYFVIYSDATGAELWKSDGTEIGTLMVKDINPNGDTSSSLGPLVEMGNMLYFKASDGVNGYELWKSDGSEVGTMMIKDIYPGADGSDPNYLTVLNNTLYFRAAGQICDDSGCHDDIELWKSDGTQAGTMLVKDINPNGSSDPQWLVQLGDMLYFAASDGVLLGGHGTELWKSDGTPEGTQLVTDINPGGLSSNPAQLTVVNNELYFSASETLYGKELWKSSGSTLGTHLVKDINPGADSNFYYLTDLNGLLFFHVRDVNGNNYQLYRSGGTDETTERIDVQEPYWIGPMVNFDGTLLLAATDGVTGTEPWAITPANTPPTITSIGDQTGYDGNNVEVQFTIGDLEGIEGLTLTKASSKPSVLVEGDINFDDSGNGLFTASLAPLIATGGSSLVTITVSDGEYEASTSFNVTWQDVIMVPGENLSSISEAIEAAYEAGVTTVIVRDGIYGSETEDVEMILDGSRGDLTIRCENGPENCIIDLQQQGRAFIFQNESKSVLDGFTIKNGLAAYSGDFPLSGYGGAISVPNDGHKNSPTITNCIFENNQAHKDGGAIHIDMTDNPERPVISNCTFIGNNAKSLHDSFQRMGEGGGGAINIDGLEAGSVEISDSTFVANTSVFGGAIRLNGYVLENSDSIIKNCEFRDNSGWMGGAVAIRGVSPLIDSSRFIQNRGTWGGAVYTTGSTIINSVFLNNKGVGFGGAIASHFYNNDYPGHNTVVAYSTLYGNSARVAGGGIHTNKNLLLVNSIVWDNSSEGTGQQVYYGASGLSGQTIKLDHSNVEGSVDDMHEPDDTSVTVQSISSISEDPLLAGDLHLLPESPCIDGGIPISAPYTPFDLSGRERKLDGDGDLNAVPDMGAYEYDLTDFTAASVSPELLTFFGRLGSALPDGQPLIIQSRGIGAAMYRIEEDISWLWYDGVDGESHEDPSIPMLYVDHSELAHGIYSGSVNIVDNRTGMLYKSVEVTLHVTAELHVPSSYSTIQQAIDAAIHGDEVIVADSNQPYYEHNIDFRGKRITVRSANGPEHTVIDAGGVSGQRGFIMDTGETSQSILQGFTIRNGNVVVGGGGLYVGLTSYPTILGCIFENNNANTGWGGGVFLLGHEVFISHCRFDQNIAAAGGGISNWGSFNTVEYSEFTENIAKGAGTNLNPLGWGGGIHNFSGSYNKIDNNIFTLNRAGRGGGAYLHLNKNATVSNSTFQLNWAQSAGDGCGGALYIDRFDQILGGLIADMTTTSVYNCLFLSNQARWYGAGIFTNSPLETVNSTFVRSLVGWPVPGNSSYNSGSTGPALYFESADQVTVKNSIFEDNGKYTDSSSYPIEDAIGVYETTVDITYCNVRIDPEFPANSTYHRTTYDPMFVNFPLTLDLVHFPIATSVTPGPLEVIELLDLRLQPASNLIDRGTDIPWLFSDIRGSMRPVDGDPPPSDGISTFDIGVYEYSEYYGGHEVDQTAKAFDGISYGSNSSTVLTGYEYELGWCDRDFFLDIPWIDQSEQYSATIVLVSEYGLRIELAHYDATATGQCYKLPFIFGSEHVGTWQLRVEIDGDPNQFVQSNEFTVEYREAIRYALSQQIIPPDDALPDLKPTIDDEESFYWSVETNRLYAIAPTTSMITWWKDEARTDPVPMVAYVTYPNQQDYPTDPVVELHIAESQPVNLFPEGTPFESARLMYLENDATISGNQFQATTEGWSVIFYRDDQAMDPDLMEHFDVVSTYVWNHDKNPGRPDNPVLNPDFPFEEVVDIGKEMTDSYHNDTCKNGYIFFPDAYYDGEGENRSYDRDSRSGPIFIVNENNPELIEDDPLVIWYHRSAVSIVCWPSKPVHYETPWPDDARKIVIASRLGSGPLSPDSFGDSANMMIYNQPDPEGIGYNPNEEHAKFFTASGSAYPAAFALRDDLHRTVWNVPRMPFTSRPYVLVKYIDPDDGRWNFEVFEVTAQSPRYEGIGPIVENETTSARYYINSGGTLTPWTWSSPLNENNYYLDVDGLIKKHGGDRTSCYNASDLLTELSNCVGANIHYFNSSGALIENNNQPDNGFSFNGLLLPGTLDVDDAYFLSEFGMLVKGDTFYRFYYKKEAGDELNPPYPLNQLTFGPCTESFFRSTDLNKVLKDKDDKFFAKHGGLMDNLAVDVVLNYYYRMQADFWYDRDANGYPDVAIGTPLAWLDGLDNNFDGATPVETTFAVFWPDPVPTLFVGETLTDAKTQDGESVGLPNIKDQCVIEVVFDQSVRESAGRSVKLIDPVVEYGVELFVENPKDYPYFLALKPEEDLFTNRWYFTALPYHLQTRLTYDPLAYNGEGNPLGKLKLKGTYTTGTGESMLLLNTLNDRDIMEIERAYLDYIGLPLDIEGFNPSAPATIPSIVFTALAGPDGLRQLGEEGLDKAVDANWNPQTPSYSRLKLAEMKALTAGDADGNRLKPSNPYLNSGYYVTLAFNNDKDDCPGPVTLNVIKVDEPLYRGELKVIESDNAFEEKVTLRHNGDFGGNSEGKWFQWRYLRADYPGIPQGPQNGAEDWQDYFNAVQNPGSPVEDHKNTLDLVDTGFPIPLEVSGVPENQMLFEGANDLIVQGTGLQLLPDKWFSVRYYYNDIGDQLSQWTKPQLYEGWVKRVMKKINLFDQKVKDFHSTEVDTLISMISLAGTAYEGDIALSSAPENLQQIGIIETYETLLNRALVLAGDEDQLDLNKAILFASNRIADLYMMIGNWNYGDGVDPTIGFSTEDGVFGSRASSIFSFENQADTLLDEELVLLRGRPDEGVRPFYNRYVWNFTLGDGEVAYVENYNIYDVNEDGELNELDAMVQYPMGHGDAWGHYLSAIKAYYDRLVDEDFTWIPAAEAILVEQTPVLVDYRDERKFAVAAAAKARTGSELVDLTYRRHYVEDPESQWQGYRDEDENRSWGVDGWARRTGQGAFFDWVVGNAILPAAGSEDIPAIQTPALVADDSTTEFILSDKMFYRPGVNYLEVYLDDDGSGPNVPVLQEETADYIIGEDPQTFHTRITFNVAPLSSDTILVKLFRIVEGIQKVDRSTVLELAEVADRYREIESRMNNADLGLNPLGIAKGAVPFDIDPDAVAAGQTHFEQIYDKALEAMSNAVAVFNYANESSNLLRRQHDSLDDFKNNIDNMEHDYNNRLVEIYGRPYPDDCGPGETYSTEYCQTGPDLYHYMYTEASEFMGGAGSAVPRVITLTFENFNDVTEDGQIVLGSPKEVKYYLDTDYRFGLVKPYDWQSKRQVPGRLQIAQSDLLLLNSRYAQTLREYDNLLLDIRDQVDLIEAQQFLSSDELRILNNDLKLQTSFNDSITSAYDNQKEHKLASTVALQVGNVIAAAFPLSAGLSFDVTSALRALAMGTAQVAAQAFSSESDSDYLAQLNNQHAKENQSALTNIELVSVRGDFADDRLIMELEKLVRSERVLRLELDNIHEPVKQTIQRYAMLLAEGVTIMQDRLRFRKQTAAKIQDYRYKDMSFRIFRNDALQKYRAQFDLTGRYVYLAAKAYDYETTLLDGETMAGQRFLTDIVRKRTIGMFEGGEPLLGTGLADPLKRMYQNFMVLKPQLGFNNPQIETNRFSMRQELFRVKMDESSSTTWRRALRNHYEEDLWNVPEFRRYCRPFAEEGIPQPGIVIPFTTTVTSGLNFFEWPLGGGDSYYSPTNFATKVRSVGVWFSNYNSVGLAQTPRIYLVPAGEDILRTPSYSTKDIRTWQVVDQKMPVPFPIVNSELENNPGWIPSVDTIFDEMFAIRRHSDFRAYHDSGYLNESEIQYDSRLIGRSVWNSRWLLIIPGRSLLYDADEGLDTFIDGPEIWGGDGSRSGYGISDIKLFFETYGYSGN